MQKGPPEVKLPEVLSGLVVRLVELLQVADLLTAAVQFLQHRIQRDVLIRHHDQHMIDEVRESPPQSPPSHRSWRR